MLTQFDDDTLCATLIDLFVEPFPQLTIVGGADEPFYKAPTESSGGILYFRSNYPRSLLHELAHYCLAGERRRQLDDFGYWYIPTGRTAEEQRRFEAVEARPQGLERAMCTIIGLKFTPSLDDFSGRPPSESFLAELDATYQEMMTTPPPTAKQALDALTQWVKQQ